MRRRTRVRLMYAVVFLIIGLGIGLYGPYLTGWSVVDRPSDNVLAEDKGGSKSGDPIKIGVMLPLTGDGAALGIPIKDAVDLAVVHAKKDGKDVVVFYEDSKCSPVEAKAAAEKLVAENVTAMIGEVCSSATFAAASVAEKNGVVLVSPASMDPSLSNAGQYVFRTVPSHALQGVLMARFARESLNADEAAVIYEDTEYGRGLARVFEQEFMDVGGEVSRMESFVPGSTEMTDELENMVNENPEVVFVVADAEDTARIILDAKKVKLSSQLLASESSYDPKVIDLAKRSANGMILMVARKNMNEEAVQFRNGIVELTRKEPGMFAAEAYDAATLVIDVAYLTRSRDGVRDALVATKNYPGASGVITFDEHGDVSRPYDIVMVKSGKFVPYIR